MLLCLRLLGAGLARIKCRGDKRSQIILFLSSTNDDLVGNDCLVGGVIVMNESKVSE